MNNHLDNLPGTRELTFLRNGVTGHRGNQSDFPENTIPSFRNAIELGVDWIELDVRKTLDGKFVVIHDPATQRTCDCEMIVSESLSEKILELDAASKFRESKGLSLVQCPKTPIPLLSEVIDLIKTQNKTRLSIQPKVSSSLNEIFAIIEKKQAELWIGFNDGNLEMMRAVKLVNNSIPVFWDRGPSDKDIDGDIQIALDSGFESMVLHESLVTEDVVKAIHEAGLTAGVWTVNDELGMKRQLAMGIDRIYTDNPALLFELKK